MKDENRRTNIKQTRSQGNRTYHQIICGWNPRTSFSIITETRSVKQYAGTTQKETPFQKICS